MDKYDEYIGNYNIYDCVVSKGIIGVLTREKDKPLSETISNKFVVLRIYADSVETKYTGDSTDIFIFNGETWREVISK